MKRVILLVVAACSAGAKAPTKPVTSTAAGVIWETPAEPWHVQHSAYSMSAEGDRVTFGGPDGWVHQFDLATGRPLRARKLAMGMVTALVELGGGRVLAVGFSSADIYSPPVVMVLDAALEPSPVTLPLRPVSKGAIEFPRALKIGDGVVISGLGLPLSIYDPKDFSVRRTLDTAVGWGLIAARGEILVAERNNQLERFDLATNGQRDLSYGLTTHLAVAEGVELQRVARNGTWIAALHRADKTKLELPDEIDSLHAYDATHFITTRKNELRIHELPSGEIKRRIKVDEDYVLAGLAVFGKRAVVVSNGVVRVIELETGLVTPKDYTRPGAWLAVGDDGVVLAGHAAMMTTHVGGKLTASERFSTELEIEALRPDDPRHYVLAKELDGKTTLELHTVGDKAVRTTLVPAKVESAYLARDGSLLLATATSDHKHVMRTRGTVATPLFELGVDAAVLGADPDGDILIGAEGQVAVADQTGKRIATLRIPHCDTLYQWALPDASSTRAVTYDSKELALWDRKTGKLIANVKVGTPADILFLPKRDELLLTFDDRVVLWTPTKGLRTLAWTGALEPAVSADGKRLALSFLDSRIALYDLDALLASTPLAADFPAGDPIPETCGEGDPLTVAKPEPDLDDDDPPPPPDDDDED